MHQYFKKNMIQKYLSIKLKLKIGWSLSDKKKYDKNTKIGNIPSTVLD